jgi:hypothetical protein
MIHVIRFEVLTPPLDSEVLTEPELVVPKFLGIRRTVSQSALTIVFRKTQIAVLECNSRQLQSVLDP